MEALLIHCLHTNFCLMKVSTRFLSASPPILLGCCSYFGFPKLLLQKMGLLDMCLFHCVHFSRLSTVLQLLPLHVGTVAFLVAIAISNSELHHNGFIECSSLGALAQLVGAKGFRSQALPGSADIYVDSHLFGTSGHFPYILIYQPMYYSFYLLENVFVILDVAASLA